MSDGNQKRHAPALDPDVKAAIGRELRVMYADIVTRGLPEHFAEILRRLDEPSNEGSKNEPTPRTV